MLWFLTCPELTGWRQRSDVSGDGVYGCKDCGVNHINCVEHTEMYGNIYSFRFFRYTENIFHVECGPFVFFKLYRHAACLSETGATSTCRNKPHWGHIRRWINLKCHCACLLTLVPMLNHWIDFHKTGYESYTVECHCHVQFNFLHLFNKVVEGP